MNKLILIVVMVIAFASCKSTNKQDTTTNSPDTMVVKPDTATTHNP